jgi:hypothetical protein
VYHLHDIFEGQRLEIEPVCGVVVRGHGLRVTVDHHRLVAATVVIRGGAKRHRGVHAGVVELDALADPVRPGTQDDHLGSLALFADLGLGPRIALVGGVVVRGAGGELGCAGVHGLVDRTHT